MAMHTILVTRPSPHGEKLCEMIEKAGGIGIFFPTMHIVPVNAPESEHHFKTLSQFDIVIFISPNAVYHSIQQIRQYFSAWPSSTLIAAIGAGTEAVLKEHQLSTSIMPENIYNSENLILHPQLLNASNKRILIVRGVGGKTLLADTLQARGAQVSHAIVYERKKIVGKTQELSQLLQQKIDAIVSTSEENLANLWEMTKESDKALLCTIPLFVVSETMLATAKKLGFTTVLVAQDPRNEAILKALMFKIA